MLANIKILLITFSNTKYESSTGLQSMHMTSAEKELILNYLFASVSLVVSVVKNSKCNIVSYGHTWVSF